MKLGLPFRVWLVLMMSLVSPVVFAQQIDDEEAEDEEPDVQLEEGQRYYYGWRGELAILDIVREKFAIEFFAPVRAEDVAEILESEALIARPRQAELTRNRDLGTIVIVRLSQALSRAESDAVRGGLPQLPGVRATHPVFRTVDREGLPGNESLLTGRISVLARADYPQDDLEAQFSAEGGVILQRIDFPRLNKAGYIVEIDPAIAAENSEDVFSIANRLHRSGAILHATPQFAPLYRQQTSPLVPADRYYKIRADSEEGGGADFTQTAQLTPAVRWYLKNDHLDAAEAWGLVYGTGFPDTTTMPFDDRIVIAGIDNGIALKYGEANLNNPVSVTLPGTPCSPCSVPGGYASGKFVSSLFPTGLEGHPDLKPNQWYNLEELTGNAGEDDDLNGYVDDYYGWDFVGNDPISAAGDGVPFPDFYGFPAYDEFRAHGNLTVGISAAQVVSVSSPTSVGTPGLCPTCLIMPIRYHVNTWDPGDTYGTSDVFYVGRLAESIVYAAESGAHVLKLMTVSETYDPLIKTAIENARAQGVFIALPSSNDGDSLDSRPRFPQAWPEVMLTGASDARGYRTLFNDGGSESPNYGWALDVTAPVAGIVPDTLIGSQDSLQWSLARGPRWSTSAYITGFGSGTSSAVPQLAGLAGLLLEANPLLSPMELQAIITRSAQDLVYSPSSTPKPFVNDTAGTGRDRFTGYGRITMDSAVILAQEYLESENRTLYYKIADSRRESGFRSLLSFHAFNTPASTLVVMDGEIVEMSTDLAPTSLPGEVNWRVNSLGNVVEGTGTPPYVARLVPPSIDSLGNPHIGQFHLASNVLTNGSFTAGEFRFEAPNGVYVASLNSQGRLEVADGYPLDIPTSDYPVEGGHVWEVTTTAQLQNALDNDAVSGDIIVAHKAIYGKITVPSGLDVVIRSTDPYDPDVVKDTIFRPANGQRAIQFSGNETEESAIIGFTFEKEAGATTGGGIDGGTNKSKARILYNVFSFCKNSQGGALSKCDGLIEGNKFVGNHSTLNGGAVFNCDGVILKNVFDSNDADVDGGALSGCDGQIYQNFFVDNFALDDGGAIVSSTAEIVGNIIFRNEADDRGGAIYASTSAAFEQNTVVYNKAGHTLGGGMDLSTPANAEFFRNNILYRNKDGAGNEGYTDQLSGSGTPNFSCIQNFTSGGTGNIPNDPLFITEDYLPTTELFDDFNDGNHTGWTVTGWSATTGIMKPQVGTGFKNFERATISGEVQARFRYVRKSTDSGHELYFQPRYATNGANVRIVFLPDRMKLVENNGSTNILNIENTSAVSTQDMWYDVFIVAKGASVEVWRRGENESDISLVLSSNSVTLTTSTRRYFRTNPGSDYWIDDIGFNARNLDYFLHLSLPDEDPPASRCIDAGDPEKGIGSLSNGINFERDFNDVINPVDVVDRGFEYEPADPNADPPFLGIHPYDMGAKEYPMPASSSFWWQNPIFD